MIRVLIGALAIQHRSKTTQQHNNTTAGRASAVTLPWNPEIAWVACDLFIRDVPLVQCPRAALRAQIKKAKGMGYQLKTGV